MKIPKWVWGVLIGAAIVGQLMHWWTLGRVDARVKELVGANGNNGSVPSDSVL